MISNRPDDYHESLPDGVQSRQLEAVNGLSMHILEAGTPGNPALLLLHGFPELAWSWRKVIGPLAAQGYHVIAPDQRGYGRTTGWTAHYETNLEPFSPLALVVDLLSLCAVLKIPRVAAVIGHDFGSPVAGWCALTRPDVFTRVVLMSAPFAGAPPLPSGVRSGSSLAPRDMHETLAALKPPRKHYQHYYCSDTANRDLLDAPQGLKRFLREYYYVKSADWPDNQPRPLPRADAGGLAELPRYYVMNQGDSMPATVARDAVDLKPEDDCAWLTNAELDVYVREFARTGFQGGLNWYRAVTTGRTTQSLFAGMAINQPSAFIAGASDWGVYQTPGAFERMQTRTLTDLKRLTLIENAGHWVQQEAPEAVINELLSFLDQT